MNRENLKQKLSKLTAVVLMLIMVLSSFPAVFGEGGDNPGGGGPPPDQGNPTPPAGWAGWDNGGVASQGGYSAGVGGHRYLTTYLIEKHNRCSTHFEVRAYFFCVL